MDESDVGVFFCQMLHEEGRHGGTCVRAAEDGVVLLVLQGQVCFDYRAFFSACQDRHDVGMGRSGEEGEEVISEAHAGVIANGKEGIKAFGCFWTKSVPTPT